MKKIIYIIILFIISFSASANDLVGTKLICAKSWKQGTELHTSKLPIDGYDFISKNRVMAYQISDPDTGFYKNKKKYKLYSDEIAIKMSSGFEFNINRTSGVRKANNLSGTGILCKSIEGVDLDFVFKRIKDLRYKNFKDNQKF